MADNGRWQVGFWVLTGLCTIWLTGLTQSVIANDRIRSNEDTQIRKSIADLLEANLVDHSLIKVALAEIKTQIKGRETCK